MQQATVRVPASTSNLGPGFDCMGVALRLHNDVTISRSSASHLPPIVRHAASLFFDCAGARPFHFSYSATNNIPRARGLGSSATVRIGVLHGLNVLMKNPLNRQQLFELAAKLESHPDNAAPAAFGGFNVVRGLRAQQFKVATRVNFVLLIPAFQIPADSRRLLPRRLDRLSAVESCGNACAVAAAFASQNYPRLRGAFADHLHQPFRKKLVPFLDTVIAAGERAGALGGFLSGSGSTIVCVTLRSPEKVAIAMLKASRLNSARTLIATADNRGSRVLPIANRKSKIENPHGSLA